LIFDTSKIQTFESAEKWLTELRENADNEIIVMLVGNKTDLKHLRAVRTEDGQDFAQKFNIGFMETSALDGSNVESAFLKIIERKNFTNLRIKKKFSTN
jgi:Ras-related protein Rab-11A